MTQSDTQVDYMPSPMAKSLRMFAYMATAIGLLFIFNNFLIFWQGWPGVNVFLAHYGLPGLDSLPKPLDGTMLTLGWVQFLVYLGAIVGSIFYVLTSPARSLLADSERLSFIVAYIIRSAFWAILLVGVVDMVISFMRVEGFLESLYL